ncbi:hypothetical protein ACFY97_06415 [Streptomyces klenkii]|uniref:hypothetical protein n=1 Tax=Streptomyces klenkii TaxID=1420899 RepID=UPI0036ED5555
MDLAFSELALAALGGVSGSMSEAVATDLWRRLRNRFSNDDRTVATLEGQGVDDPDAVAALSEALRREATADPEFRRELEDLQSRLARAAASTINTVRDSHGLNAPGATFNGAINMSFGLPEQGQ